MDDIQSRYHEEISFKKFIKSINEWVKFIRPKLLYIFFIGLISSVIGFYYAAGIKTNYRAKLTFIVEDGKGASSNLGGIASLAGQFGVDVSGTASAGLFSSENIILYLKSPTLAREVLLTRLDTLGSQTLADFYVEVYGLSSSWKNRSGLKNVVFHPLDTNVPYSRIQDSLLQTIIFDINRSQLIVSKTDKKASFIDVVTIMQNELLAKIYCERIVKKAVSQYIDLKTQRQNNAVLKLQSRADSIAQLLNNKILTGASSQTLSTTMDINPLYKTKNIFLNEITSRDKSILSSIYSTVSQNLELAKFNLSQESPIIQIVDPPFMPLEKIVISKFKTAIFFFVFSTFTCIFLVTVRKIFLDYLK